MVTVSMLSFYTSRCFSLYWDTSQTAEETLKQNDIVINTLIYFHVGNTYIHTFPYLTAAL